MVKRIPSIFPFLALLTILTVIGCALLPTGPSVSMMPGAGKTSDQFKADDVACRQSALQQITQQTNDQNSAAGASAGKVYGVEAQQLYDKAYTQCMYAKGNQEAPPTPPPAPY